MPATTTPVRSGLVLLITACAQFLVILDETVVNVALPSISRDLAFANASSPDQYPYRQVNSRSSAAARWRSSTTPWWRSCANSGSPASAN